jgi:hypothetical protein
MRTDVLGQAINISIADPAASITNQRSKQYVQGSYSGTARRFA